MSEHLVPIGEVVRRFGLRHSALRYYEERALLPPATRRGGRRYYGPAELRRLALIRMLQQDGLLRLEEIAELLASPPSGARAWHERLAARATALEAQIVRLRGAIDFLQHWDSCPRDNPIPGCPFLEEELERRVAGALGAG